MNVYMDRMIGDSEESKSFKVQLMDYWSSKNMSNIKIPQIGGRELDFFKLYKAVIKRGGAQAVSNNKMWKEIVNEFGFPSTCTSASFTLRNHYTRFLLGYEQKYFFNKDDDEALPQLKAGRKRQKKGEHNNDGTKGDSSESESESNGEELKESAEKKLKPDLTQQRVQPANQQFPRQNIPRNVGQPVQVIRTEVSRPENTRPSVLQKQLNEAYSMNASNNKQEIFYTKKNKMFPMVPDMKRILLAFESGIQDEITFALNSMLLYSVNSIHLFVLENHGNLLDSVLLYAEQSIRNIPSLNHVLKFQELKPKVSSFATSAGYSYNGYSNSQIPAPPATKSAFSALSVLDHYNFGVCDILLFNSQQNKDISPLAMLHRKRQDTELIFKEKIGEVSLLEQVRTIFLILRNFSYTKQNEMFMYKNEKLIQLAVQLFILNCDSQITKYILDILANISKHMQLLIVSDYKLLCERLFEVLNADTSEELEAAVDIIRNLIAIPENESIIEGYLQLFIDQVTRLMLQAQGDIREGILEFLCFLSDLKMTTRVSLARHPKLIMRLVGLLTSGVAKYPRHSAHFPGGNSNNTTGNASSETQQLTAGSSAERNQEKITKLAALTLSNISLAPSSRAYLKPFERDLFVVAATDETVTKYIANILNELVNYDPETDPERQAMFNTSTF